jgi:hypothetical protein
MVIMNPDGKSTVRKPFEPIFGFECDWPVGYVLSQWIRIRYHKKCYHKKSMEGDSFHGSMPVIRGGSKVGASRRPGTPSVH